jgi:hypothetical protein
MSVAKAASVPRELLGGLDQHTVPDVYGAADAFVLASFSEAIPRCSWKPWLRDCLTSGRTAREPGR